MHLVFRVMSPAHALQRSPAAHGELPTMKTPAFRLSALALALATQGALAYEYNVDLKNTGTTTAYDVAVVLSGNETLASTFNGYQGGPLDGYFTDVQESHPASGDTIIHWMNIDGMDSPIPPGRTIHIGWSTQDCDSAVKDMYWTTKSHGRLSNSVLHNVTHNLTYVSGRPPIIDFNNVMEAQVAIRVRDVRFAVVDAPLKLEALSSVNAALMKSLRSVKEGAFVLAPGERVSFTVPVALKEGQSLITVYSTGDVLQGATSATNQGADSLHFMQRPVGGGGHGNGC